MRLQKGCNGAKAMGEKENQYRKSRATSWNTREQEHFHDNKHQDTYFTPQLKNGINPFKTKRKELNILI